MAITGIVTATEKTKEFDDASSLYEFQIDGAEEKFTCRTFDDARHPVVGDSVLVFLMAERNHASQVVFDADLGATRKALS